MIKIIYKQIILIFLLLLLVAIIFVWPMFARNNCMNLVQHEIDAPGTVAISRLNTDYRLCLAKHGVKPEALFSSTP